MHDDDTPVASADQDAWLALTRTLRAELAKLAPHLGAMEGLARKTFVQTCQAAYWLEYHAQQYDRENELRQARTSYQE